MPMFSRFCIFVCVLGILLFASSTVDVHAQGRRSLEVAGITGLDTGHPVGSTVSVHFSASDAGAVLTITHSGLTNVSVANGGTVVTNVLGSATVTGTITGRDAWVQAEWRAADLTARADLGHFDDYSPPALIVVNPPEPKSMLGVGDTFTQMISIENRGEYSTLPLSAWQMDVVFNPLILEVVDVAEGDFLESGGEDAVFAYMMSSGKISVSQARAGQMPNADPALPNVATVPSPAGIALAPGDEGTLLKITFRVLAVSEEALGIHNVKLQSDKDDNEDGTLDRISYSILVTDVFVATHMSSAKEDVNQDGDVNILDLVVVAGSIGMVPPNPRADVNGDGSVNVLDIVAIYTSDLWATSIDSKEVNDANEPALTAPSASRNVTPTTIQSWIDLARVENDGSAIFEQGIANLEALLATQIPSKTKLLLNYPNPFNPETWIPYQLAKASDVTVMIHATNGSLIRTLELGHQAAGLYQSKSRAAYWDGRNELGEHVASGLYFYTLTAGKFSATGKMLVRK